MYLIDTSVWIDFTRAKSTPAVEFLKNILIEEQQIGITSTIYQEILQGSESQERFVKFQNYFSELSFYHPKHPLESYAKAAHISAQRHNHS